MRLFVAVFALCAAAIPAAAQRGPIIAGAGTVYNLPIGSLANRYKAAFGGALYAGQQVSERWSWTGRLEYFEMNDLASDKLIKTVLVQQGSSTLKFTFPLSKLSMGLKAASARAEAGLNLYRDDVFGASMNLGFGFTYWDNRRGGYNDSLFAVLPGASSASRIAVVNVPENSQHDWSGTLTAGAEARVCLLQPVWLTAGFEYKLIVGELWQALALDMENVSGMQFISIRAGFRAEF